MNKEQIANWISKAGSIVWQTLTETTVTTPAWSIATATIFSAITGNLLVGIVAAALLIVPARLGKPTTHKIIGSETITNFSSAVQLGKSWPSSLSGLWTPEPESEKTNGPERPGPNQAGD